MIDISDEEVLEHFKEAFLPKIETQLLEINDKEIASGKAKVLYCC